MLWIRKAIWPAAVRLSIAALMGLIAGFPTLALAQGAAVGLSLAERTYSFAEDGPIELEILLSGAEGVTGVDFVVAYPSERLLGFVDAIEGDLGMTFAVNPEYGSPPSGSTWIKFSGARAEPLPASTDGVLVRLVLEAPCAGNAQDWPAGRPLSFDFPEGFAKAFAADVSPLSIEASSGSILLDCTSLSVEDLPSFGTLKALYGPGTGGR
jgi:hypothetical protein